MIFINKQQKMKISDLKKSIREMIVAELSESEAYEITGRSGTKTTQTFKDSTEANKFKTSNTNIASIKKLEEETPNPLSKQLADIENQINRLTKQRDELKSSLGMNKANNIEETILNEAPVYDVTDMEGFNKAYDEFKENPPIKSKSLDLLLNKLKDEGTVDTSALSKEKGVDSAIFNNQIIRKFISDPGGEFTEFLTKKDKRADKKSNPEVAARKAEEEKAKEEKRAEKAAKRAEKEKAKAPAQKPSSPEYKKTTTMVDMSDEPLDSDIAKTEKELKIDEPKVKKPSKLSAEDQAKFDVALKGITAKINRIKDKKAKPDDLALLKKAYNDEGIKKLFRKAGKNLDDLVAGVIGGKDKGEDIESNEL